MVRRLLFLQFTCILIISDVAFCFEYDLQGQFSSWANRKKNLNEWQINSGIRYIPEINIKQSFQNESFIDTEISLNGFMASDFNIQEKNLKLYRFRLRFATAQTETQLGLQKINFGPAFILRSLMWFDRLDPRDPLQMTDGIYALRFKYNFLNNTNIWVWGLYGNEKTKGYEVFPTTPKKPEFGGRFQLPIPYGEFGTTFHTRNVDAGDFKYDESRLAFDGRWDMILGFWFESVFQYSNSYSLPYEWNKMITLGSDYTFGIGNGVHVLAEHMTSIASKKTFGRDDDVQVSAIYLNYPIGFFDNVMAIGYYSWENRKYYQYIGWQRTYDDLIFNLSLFYYPQSEKNSDHSEEGKLGAGYGAQIMFIYNH